MTVLYSIVWASQLALVVKNLPANAGDMRRGFNLWVRSPGGENGNPLQYSCLESPMGRGVWWATVRRVLESKTRLKQLCMQAHAFYCIWFAYLCSFWCTFGLFLVFSYYELGCFKLCLCEHVFSFLFDNYLKLILLGHE